MSWNGNEGGQNGSSMQCKRAGRRCAPPASSRRWINVVRAPSGARSARRLASARGAPSAFLLLRSRRAAWLKGDAGEKSREQSRLSGWAGGTAAA